MSEYIVAQAKVQPIRANAAHGILRRCSNGVECPECRARRLQNKGMLQRAAINAVPAPAVPSIVHTVLNSPGQSLNASTRSFMEPRFGHDFSGVRVHTDAQAAESANAVNALAYTVGRDVVFGTGQYMPETMTGKRLLAHELTHVVQQNNYLYGQNVPLHIDGDESRLEAEAKAREVGIQIQPTRIAGLGTLQRSGKNPNPQTGHCGGVYGCANGDKCLETDNTGPFLPEPPEGSGLWQIKVYIDVDVARATDITGGADVGHTFVEFVEATGATYTYGFYPNPETKPNEFHPKVFGCVVHPDTNHRSCTDYIETINVTKKEYKDALTFAQNYCKAPDKYELFTNNCTTFAQLVVKIAGKSLPPIRGPVGPLGNVNADNPNTLLDNLKARDAHNKQLGQP